MRNTADLVLRVFYFVLYLPSRLVQVWMSAKSPYSRSCAPPKRVYSYPLWSSAAQAAETRRGGVVTQSGGILLARC